MNAQNRRRPFQIFQPFQQFLLLLPFLFFSAGCLAEGAAGKPQYMGVKVCVKCHYDHNEAWGATVHARSFDSLKPGTKAEEKRKAGLDPAADYTKSEKCLVCHTTGFGAAGGYAVGASSGGGALGAVGCEECHGAGEFYRDEHGKADSLFKKEGKKSARSLLVAAKQNFDYRQACMRCHDNYEGSDNPAAKAPHSPFTPKVDAKYRFDYQQALRSIGKGKAIHVHYKLIGIFEGDPVPAERAEFQKTAIDPPAE